MNILQKGLVSVLTVAALSTLYGAQFEIMPTVGKKIANDDTTLDDSKVLLGIRGTAYVTPNVGIQLVGETSSKNPTIGGGDTDIERGAVNVILESGTQKVRPYLLAGAGYERTHGATVQTTDDDSQMFYNAGAGVKFGMTDRVSLVTEVKGIHKVENHDDDIIGTVGLGVKLGDVGQPRPNCNTPEAMSLDQFAKMCKTKKPAVSNVVQITQPVQQFQQEPQVVSEPVSEPVMEEIVDEKTRCVVDVDGGDIEMEGPVVTDSASDTGTIPEGYYVQMAALFKGNGEMLTSRLERKNYHYVLHHVNRFGKEATLVLVGPYQTRRAAAVALRYLRRLSRNAFVKRFP
ncbi:MAG: hypothetical protein DSZ05_08500 [Sulfurospirillum sp.]|nr:MAG: hypothetical protein DSZ05_08500 [Sulfurospirillum sp.]